MKITWKINKAQYCCGELAFVGKWRVGSASLDSCRERNDPKKYEASCLLPGIKHELGHFLTEQEAKDVVEKAINHWIKGLETI